MSPRRLLTRAKFSRRWGPRIDSSTTSFTASIDGVVKRQCPGSRNNLMSFPELRVDTSTTKLRPHNAPFATQFNRSLLVFPQLLLVLLYKIADPVRILFPVAGAVNRIGAAAGFDPDVRPQDAGFDVDTGDVLDVHGVFIASEPTALDMFHALRTHYNYGGEKMISTGAAAGDKRFRLHGT